MPSAGNKGLAEQSQDAEDLQGGEALQWPRCRFLKTRKFISSEDLEQTPLRFVALHNHQLLHSVLKSSTPMQAMKQWCKEQPHSFNKPAMRSPGCDKPVRLVIATVQPERACRWLASRSFALHRLLQSRYCDGLLNHSRAN